VYPVHFNPNVRVPVYEILDGTNNIHLISPLGYEEFAYLLSQCYFVLTDSGGIQEEAPSLGKPVLVMRGSTERPEAVEAGTAILVGADEDNIVAGVCNLLRNEDHYWAMAQAMNPYGDGRASEKILSALDVIKNIH
jgi:UDP-N-acetylglucosamine 2-epimerase (non-hydrolysing)